ncbi:MAG: J domain-containing protein [Chloroflexi bacterium]|nr:J domain-containing protein [Chloroflexota bacterium]
MNESPHAHETRRRQPNADELQPYSDPYAALNVPRDATLETIKDAYFQLVREHPPEREPEAFKQIRAAYERLRTPERQLETDMLLLQELPLPTDLPETEFDLTVHREDLLSAARALTDLERTDFHDEFRKVTLSPVS